MKRSSSRARLVEDPERRVARAGHVTRGLDDPLEQRLEVQHRDQRAARLDEALQTLRFEALFAHRLARVSVQQALFAHRLIEVRLAYVDTTANHARARSGCMRATAAPMLIGVLARGRGLDSARHSYPKALERADVAAHGRRLPGDPRAPHHDPGGRDDPRGREPAPRLQRDDRARCSCGPGGRAQRGHSARMGHGPRAARLGGPRRVARLRARRDHRAADVGGPERDGARGVRRALAGGRLAPARAQVRGLDPRGGHLRAGPRRPPG